jgi:hypothetical protein
MHLLCSGSQRTRLRDGDERTDIVEIDVIHRQSFLSRPRKGGNGIILRGFVRLRESQHASNFLSSEPITALRWCNPALRYKAYRDGYVYI